MKSHVVNYFRNNNATFALYFRRISAVYPTKRVATCGGETLFRARAYLLSQTPTAGVYMMIKSNASKTYRSLITRITDHGGTS